MEGTNPLFEWFHRQVDKEVKKDAMPKPDRIGQVVGIIAIGVFLAFFIIHQTRPTGFFTSEFGGVETVLFYSAGAYGLIPSLIRLWTGRKNPARIIDAAGSALAFVAIIYMLAVFPFDFSHVAAPLPSSLEFLLDWVSDGFAKIGMVLGLVAMAFTTPYAYFMYFAVRKKLAETPVGSTESSADMGTA